MPSVATTAEILPRTALLAEIFRNERGPAKFQVGACYALGSVPLETYVSYGNRLGRAPGESWWVTAGMRIYTRPFLP